MTHTPTLTPVDEPIERAAFEAWFRTRHPFCGLQRRGLGDYWHEPAETAWQAWRARAGVGGTGRVNDDTLVPYAGAAEALSELCTCLACQAVRAPSLAALPLHMAWRNRRLQAELAALRAEVEFLRIMVVAPLLEPIPPDAKPQSLFVFTKYLKAFTGARIWRRDFPTTTPQPTTTPETCECREDTPEGCGARGCGVGDVG